MKFIVKKFIKWIVWLLARTPYGRYFQDQFLASSQAGAITGQCINVDCGVMPQ